MAGNASVVKGVMGRSPKARGDYGARMAMFYGVRQKPPTPFTVGRSEDQSYATDVKRLTVDVHML